MCLESFKETPFIKIAIQRNLPTSLKAYSINQSQRQIIASSLVVLYYVVSTLGEENKVRESKLSLHMLLKCYIDFNLISV